MSNGSVTTYGIEEYEKGLKALKDNKLEDAVQLLGQGLQSLAEKYGDYSREEVGDIICRAQEEVDVFGSTLQSAVAKRDGATSSAEAIQDETKKEDSLESDGEENEEQEEGDAAGQEEEEEEAEDDMELAWENLEVARKIYSKNESTHANELASVHMGLADLATEQESFEEALSDYTQALALLEPLLKASDRQLAELHFKTGLALQFLNRPVEGLEQIRKAIEVCQAASEEAKAGESSKGGAEDDELQGVLLDLRAKEEELEEVIKEVEKTKKTLRAAFQSVVGSAPAGLTPAPFSTAPANVVDLGVVGQGKKRINLAPVPTPTGPGNDKGLTNGSSKPRPKRNLEDLMGGADSTEGFASSSLPASKKPVGTTGPGNIAQADAVAAISTKPVAKTMEPSAALPESMKAETADPQELHHKSAKENPPVSEA